MRMGVLFENGEFSPATVYQLRVRGPGVGSFEELVGFEEEALTRWPRSTI